MDHNLERFAQIVRQGEAMELAEAALLIAKGEYPDLDVPNYLDRLDRLAARADGGARVKEPRWKFHYLRWYLFNKEWFQGNTKDYFDPRNSFLNDVLDRKLGIPVTLSVVFIEVGRRLGLELQGIGLPGHFVVQYQDGDESLFIDTFNHGAIRSVEECEQMASLAMRHDVRLEPIHFRPLTKQQILIRILGNLREIYFNREEWENALAVVERLQVLAPDDPLNFRHRGVVFGNLSKYHRAIAEFEEYLNRNPKVPDAATIQHMIGMLRRNAAALN